LIQISCILDVAEVLAPVDVQPGPQIPASPQSSVRPTIDDMIQRLQQEQRRLNHEHDYTARRPLENQEQNESPRARHSSRSQRTAGSRRTGDVEGVRQPANFMSRDRELNLMVPIWAKKMVVTPLSYDEALKAKFKSMATADAEEAFFNKERKKRPQIEDASVNLKLAIREERFTRRKRRIIQQRQGMGQLSTRNRYARRPDGRHHNGITDYENPEELSDDSDSDYTGDKEWADTSSDSESEETEDSEWDTCLPSTSRIRKRNSSSAEDEEDRESGEVRRSSRKLDKLDKKQAKKLRERIKKQQLEEKYNSIKELPEDFRPPGIDLFRY
jgi:hypothetical protein